MKLPGAELSLRDGGDGGAHTPSCWYIDSSSVTFVRRVARRLGFFFIFADVNPLTWFGVLQLWPMVLLDAPAQSAKSRWRGVAVSCIVMFLVSIAVFEEILLNVCCKLI